MLNVDVLGGLFRDFIFYGNEIHTDEVLELPGGTGFNVYKGLATLGINTVFHGSFGTDWPFEKIGSERCGKSGIFVSRNEKEVLSVYRGVNVLTKFEEPSSTVLFASLECGEKIFEEYASYVKDRGGFVFLDPSPIFEWRNDFIELTDVLLPNEAEFEVVSKVKGTYKRPVIFEKMGQNGGRLIENEVLEVQPEHINNYPLSCGDVFDAVVVWGMLNNLDKKDILSYAVSVSTYAAGFKGSSSAVVKAISDFARNLKIF